MTNEQVYERIQEIYPNQSSIGMTNFSISQIKMLHPEYDIEQLIEKYEKHIKWWQHSYGSKEKAGYATQEMLNKRLTFESFLNTSAYNMNWDIPGNVNRDKYIFGENKVLLMEIVSDFNKQIKKMIDDIK